MSKTSKIVTKTLAGVLSLAMVVTSLSVTSTISSAKAKIKSIKKTLETKIISLLEDNKTHNYVIHPKTEKTPSAVEVTLEDITSNIRNNVYILAEIESELKTLYDFPEVHINVTDTDDADFVNLTVFMVLE